MLFDAPYTIHYTHYTPYSTGTLFDEDGGGEKGGGSDDHDDHDERSGSGSSEEEEEEEEEDEDTHRIRIVAAAAGYRHSIALSDNGDVYAFGSNAHGQLGEWAPSVASVIQQVSGLQV
jgi:hypothetical protein